MMDEEPAQYLSYLLRAWRSGAAHSARWLVSLEDTRTGERRGFAGLAEAFAFLENQMAAGLQETLPDSASGSATAEAHDLRKYPPE